jgi:hypothetical protein
MIARFVITITFITITLITITFYNNDSNVDSILNNTGADLITNVDYVNSIPTMANNNTTST